MKIRDKLIAKLVEEDNYSFLLDLNELMPDILTEMRMKVFESSFTSPESWSGYESSRDDKVMRISKKEFSRDGFFHFSIHLGNEHKSIFYGITGPWNKLKDNSEVVKLKDESENIGLEFWSVWMYRYFDSPRSSLMDSLRNNQSTDVAVAPFWDEFLSKCVLLIPLLESANKEVLKH